MERTFTRTFLRRAAMTLLLAVLTTATAWALQPASDDQFATDGGGGSGETLTETFANISFTSGGTNYVDQTISGGNLGTWTATSCRGDQGSPVIRYAGTLTSPTIADGVAAVEFDYDWPFSESGSCNIELYVGGTSVGTATVSCSSSGTATYTLDSPVAGPTTIEFLNKASSNKRMRVTQVRITTPSSGSLIDPAIAYYQNADGKTGAALKTAMCGIIYNRTEQQYKDLWEAFKTTDLRNDGKIWDMYSNITNYEPASKGETYRGEGDCYNREHSFPKSWFGGEVMPMFSDLHHIYPTDGYINGRRSNNPYGETSSPTYSSSGGFSKLGPCSISGYNGTVFEPADEYKGDFARTYFYMVTCYEEKLADWVTNYGATTEVDDVLDGTTYPAFTTWQLNMLMKWAKDDPVSEKETARNNAVYAIQKNRNPFIDYPGLEEYIWGTMTTTAFDYYDYVQPTYKQDVTMSFSPSEATASIGEDFTEPTLTTTPANLNVIYSSSNTNVATVDASTGEVTLVAAGSTTITATFAGNDDYSGGTASYTLTVSNPALIMGETLLYEGLSNYSGEESSQAMSTSYQYLDYKKWNDITAVFAGAKSDAYKNGGCLKFGSGSAMGSMTTSNITLTGGGTLTFYLKKYGSDTGKLNVTVTGATADETSFTPTSNWTLCTVNLSNVTDNVTITLATSSKRAYVDEITLTNNSTLNLANNGDNASIIATAANNGGKFNVMLKDRTLYRDGKWNTLCLPFDYDLDAYDSPIDGNGLTVMAFDETSSSFDNGTLTLNFTTVYDGETKGNLVAGTPYLIKWDEDTYNPTITNPVFNGVTIDATTRNKTCALGGNTSITFCGTFDPEPIYTSPATNLYLGENNTLYWPSMEGYTIGAFRAYFHLDGLTCGEPTSSVRAFNLGFGDGSDETTGILSTTNFTNSAAAWYDLQGRKLSAQPTQKGLYIHNGHKFAIK